MANVLQLLFISAVCVATVYPHSGANSFPAGGGGKCTYQYATHDGSPVVTSAACSITAADLNKGTEPGTTARSYVRKLGGHDGCDNDDAGHILANRLGGKAEPTNLFPQSPHLNRGAWEQFERAIAACMDGGGASTAKLSWEFHYDSTTKQRPSTATYSASYDKGCSATSQSFSNVCDSAGETKTAVLSDSRANSAQTVAKTVNLQLSCLENANVTAGSSSGNCVVHDHSDGSYAITQAGSPATQQTTRFTPGKQLDILHLQQAAAGSVYAVPSQWCISEKSHVTASGNLVLVLGVAKGAAAGLELDCTSRSADLDIGDCTTLTVEGVAGESLHICYDG